MALSQLNGPLDSGQGPVLASTMPRAPKHGIKWFNCTAKTIHFVHLGLLSIYGHIDSDSDAAIPNPHLYRRVLMGDMTNIMCNTVIKLIGK